MNEEEKDKEKKQNPKQQNPTPKRPSTLSKKDRERADDLLKDGGFGTFTDIEP